MVAKGVTPKSGEKVLRRDTMKKPTRGDKKNQFREGAGTKDAARILGTTSQMVTNLIRRHHGTEKELPYWIRGGRYQYDLTDVANWGEKFWRRNEAELAKQAKPGRPMGASGMTIEGIQMTAAQRSNMAALCARWNCGEDDVIRRCLNAPPHAVAAALEKSYGGDSIELTPPKQAMDYIRKVCDFRAISGVALVIEMMLAGDPMLRAYWRD